MFVRWLDVVKNFHGNNFQPIQLGNTLTSMLFFLFKNNTFTFSWLNKLNASLRLMPRPLSVVTLL